MPLKTISQVAIYPYGDESQPNLIALDPKPDAKRAIVFVGGLGNAPFGVTYSRALHSFIEKMPWGDHHDDDDNGWTVVEPYLSSSGTGYGSGSVRRDAQEIARLVEYLASPAVGKEEVILLGHSTGTQDLTTLSYLWSTEPESLPWTEQGGQRVVRGIALQAPVSDRDYVVAQATTLGKLDALKASIATAEAQQGQDEENDAAPLAITSWAFGKEVRITHKRWRSLTAPPPLADGNAKGAVEPQYKVDVDVSEDYFSADLPESYHADVFGKFKPRVAFFMGRLDETYPKSWSDADLQGLLDKFLRNVPANVRSEQASAIIPGATHAISSEEAQKIFFGKLKRFMEECCLPA